jgi:hypothetical protein
VKFDQQIAAAAYQNRDNILALPPVVKEQLLSQIVGIITQLENDRMRAKICFEWKIDMQMRDGTIMRDQNTLEPTKPHIIWNPPYYEINGYIKQIGQWDPELCSQMKYAVKAYERAVMAQAAKFKDHTKAQAVLDKVGPFWNYPGPWLIQ